MARCFREALVISLRDRGFMLLVFGRELREKVAKDFIVDTCVALVCSPSRGQALFSLGRVTSWQ